MLTCLGGGGSTTPSLFFLSVQNLSPLHAPSVLKRGRERGREVSGAAATSATAATDAFVVVAGASVVAGGTNLPEVDGRRR